MARRTRHPAQRRSSRALLVAFGLAAITIAVGGTLFSRDQAAVLRQQAEQQVLAIWSLKVTELASWRSGRIAEAEVFHGNSAFIEVASRLIENPDDPAAEREVLPWLTGMQHNPAYDAVVLTDADGDVVLRVGAEEAIDSNHVRESVRSRIASGEVTFVDFHRASEEAHVHLSLIVPLVQDGRSDVPVGALVLTIDPNAYLYPFIQSWPVPSETGETLLVRRDGDRALFLNDLRFKDGAAMDLALSLDSEGVPSVEAILGHTGLVEGVDYRGVPVLAAVGPVPDSPWYLVAKMDSDEAFARLRSRLEQIIILVGAAAALVVGLAALLWRHQAARHYREEYEAERERAWLRDVIERSTNEIYVFDAETLRFRFVNEGASSHTGYSREEFLGGMTPLDLKPAFTESGFRAMVAPLLADERAMLSFETVHRRKDGSEYPIEVRIQAAESHHGRVFLAIINDITERKDAEVELEQHRLHLEELVDERTEELTATNEELDSSNEELAATNEELEGSNQQLLEANLHIGEAMIELDRVNSELEAANLAKNTFLASMSHELRTPLNSVIGFSEMLGKGLVGELTEEQARQIGMINASGQHLLSLIDDVLDLAKVEAGKAEVRIEEIDVAGLARDIVALVEPMATAKGLALRASAPDGETVIESDCGKVQQILLNLVGNAIKFTERGTIELTLERLPAGGAAFTVTDPGPGIPAEALTSIFDPFVQYDGGRPESSKPKGTGLGLALSQKYARLLGGEVTVATELGAGSAFTLTLPEAPPVD
jgi:PAS domain S-box-containing protein